MANSRERSKSCRCLLRERAANVATAVSEKTARNPGYSVAVPGTRFEFVHGCEVSGLHFTNPSCRGPLRRLRFVLQSNEVGLQFLPVALGKARNLLFELKQAHGTNSGQSLPFVKSARYLLAVAGKRNS